MPNPQNIPHRTEAGQAIRSAFTPKDNLTSADYAELELRVMANIATEHKNAYFKRMVEADAAWAEYCTNPTNDAWNKWVEAKHAERKAGMELKEIDNDNRNNVRKLT